MSEDVSGDEDLATVRRAQAGELDAFEVLVEKYQSLMSGLLYRFARDRADLEDLVQETFVRAWRGLEGWRAEKPFLHWLKRIAVRVGLEFCRRHQRTPFARLAGVDEPGRVLEQVAGESASASAEAADEAAYVLSHLGAEDRVLLTLLYLEEMPVHEIASHFGWSRVKTKVRAFRARQQLRTVLERHGYTIK